MGYTSLSEIQNAIDADVLQQLTDDDDTGNTNDGIVQAAIDEASEEINLYLRERYALPFEETPKIIRQLCNTITVYYLYLRRHDVPEKNEQAYKNAIKILDKLSTGKVSLNKKLSDSGPRAFKPRGTNFVHTRPLKAVDLGNY